MRKITNVIERQKNETTEIYDSLKILWDQQNLILQELKKKRDHLREQESLVDLQISDCNHYLEFANCDAVDLVLIAKKIQELRKKRREIKNEFELVSQILNKHGQNLEHLSDTFKMSYNFRTDVINDVATRKVRKNGKNN